MHKIYIDIGSTDSQEKRRAILKLMAKGQLDQRQSILRAAFDDFDTYTFVISMLTVLQVRYISTFGAFDA